MFRYIVQNGEGKEGGHTKNSPMGCLDIISQHSRYKTYLCNSQENRKNMELMKY